MIHWICPLLTRGSPVNPDLYRGVYLTSQISKFVERVLAYRLIVPLARNLGICGENQFAYTRGRGARDVIAFLVMFWLFAFAAGKKVALYCSDVVGVFDKVEKSRLLEKFRRVGLHPKLVEVLDTWLRDKRVQIVINGAKSNFFIYVQHGLSKYCSRAVSVEYFLS